MRVAVTGGAGFIGSWVVEVLVEKGYDVVVIDNFSSGSRSNLASVEGVVKVVECDVRDFSNLLQALKGCDAVIHLAALVSVDAASENPRLAIDVNVVGTLNVLEACRRVGCSRLVYASSAAVYGEPVKLPVAEDHPTVPINVYGASKLSGEALVLSYNRNFGLSTIALRYFNVYGPRQRGGPYAGVITKFITAALKGEELTIFGDGMQTRDFVYVRDVAEATVKALESEATGVFNVGTGVETKIIDLARKILRLTGSSSRIRFASPRPGDIRRSVADISRIRAVLGWEPRTGLDDGLKKTIEWFRYELKP